MKVGPLLISQKSINTAKAICGLNATNTISHKGSSIEQAIKTAIETLAERAEREVPEYGRLFKPVQEEFTNPDTESVAKTIKFTIKSSTNKNNPLDRILKMDIISEKQNSISPIFKVGKKQDLINTLKSDKFAFEVKEEINKATPAVLKRTLGS